MEQSNSDLDRIIAQLYDSTCGHPLIETPFGKRYLINADVTSSGFPNRLIESIIDKWVLPYYSNTHSNAYGGRLMSHYIEQSKEIIRKSVNARVCDQIIFTGNGCSGSINHLIHCMDLRNHSKQHTVVFISTGEHHSNHLPWTHLPVTLIYVPLLKSGLIDIKFLGKQLIKYQNYPNIIASFIATSNVTGVHQKTHMISQLIHKYRGLIFWDFAASAPYLPINMHKNDSQGQYYDAVFISTHKFFGGPGSPGILIARQNLFKNDIPFCPGGGTVRFVCDSFKTYSPNIETKETGGTPDIIGCIRAGLAFDLKTRYQQFISFRDKQLVYYVQSRLSQISNLRLLNPIKNLNRQPIFIFMIDGIHYNLVVVILSDLFGIQTRGGISCCSLLAQDILGISPQQQKEIYNQIINDKGTPSDYGWCRLSFHYSMPDFIIEYIINAVEYVAKYGFLFLNKNIYEYYPIKNNWLFSKNGFPWDYFRGAKLSLDQSRQLPRSIYLNPNILKTHINESYNILQNIRHSLF